MLLFSWGKSDNKSMLKHSHFLSGTTNAAYLFMECLKHHGHKEDLEMTPKTCGAVGERAQVILVWG
jgi:hypothetical protein